MKLKQMTLPALYKIILRLFPGLAGYHVMRYAKVIKVYQGKSLDVKGRPGMAVDLRFVKHNLKIDRKFNIFKRVRLAGGSEFVQAPPSEGTYILIAFPFWMANTATVFAVLYLNRVVNPEKDTYKIQDCEKLKLSAKSELVLGDGNDLAVLGNRLTTVLKNMCDQIIALGQRDNMGTPLPTLPDVQTNLEIIKQTLPDDILSDIKLGKGTDAPLS